MGRRKSRGTIAPATGKAAQQDDIYEEKLYPNEPDMPPPDYEEAAAGPSNTGKLNVELAPVAAAYVRYDTMTSFAGLDTQNGPSSIKLDPAGVGHASYIVTNNMVSGALDEPFPVQCPYCHAIITTRTVHVAGCMAYLSCMAVGVLTSFLGCCLVPLCLKRCKDVKHYCPECDNLIAIYKRL